MKSIETILIMLFSIVTIACAPNSFRSKDLPSSSTPHETAFRESIQSCLFADPTTLSNIIKHKLNITAGDVPMVEKNGDVKKDNDCKGGPVNGECYYLAKYRTDLGEGDPTKGRTANAECSPTKFRITSEMFINACEIALQSPAVKNKLFPAGVNDFNYIYLTFIGRKPADVESAIIQNLQKNFSDETKKAVAACAAVASSLESLTIM